MTRLGVLHLTIRNQAGWYNQYAHGDRTIWISFDLWCLKINQYILLFRDKNQFTGYLSPGQGGRNVWWLIELQAPTKTPRRHSDSSISRVARDQAFTLLIVASINLTVERLVAPHDRNNPRRTINFQLSLLFMQYTLSSL